MAAMAAASPDRREGDISDSFASLAGIKDEPLPDKFRQLKLSLVRGREQKIIASWDRLLQQLKVENDMIADLGPKVIPEVSFDDLDGEINRTRDEIRKRGAAVIRGVIPEDEARNYKFELEEYIHKNPQTKGNNFPLLIFLSSECTRYWISKLTTHNTQHPQASPRATPKSGNSTGPRPSSAPASTPTSRACSKL